MKETLQKILMAIENAGGEIFVVGGPVRDRIRGQKPKDIDFLVRNMSLADIASTVKTIGKADEVGKAFGVVKGNVDGMEFDFAIPRTKETKTGDSHTDFAVEVDPFAKVEDDLGRRDFTCNAMAMPLAAFMANDMGKVIDPYNGRKDMEAGVLRAVGNPKARFTEDPLRMLRAVQFATRMGYAIEPVTLEAIKSMVESVKTVSGERILEELKKAWTKGTTPGVLLNLLSETGMGKTIFGNDFNPLSVTLPKLSGDEKILGMFVAFFLLGGNYAAAKPEAIMVKLLELARKVESGVPYAIIGNMKPMLPILYEVFVELDKAIAEKIKKMMETAITPKELVVSGEEIAATLGVKPGKIIGEVQKAMLDAIWNGKIVNDKKQLTDFIAQIKA